MTTAKSTQPGNDWFNTQQQYWDSWFEAQRKAMGGQFSPNASTSPSPWNAFFTEWQKTISGGQPASNTDVFQQYFAKAGQTYLDMMQQFYQGTGQAKPVSQMTQDWLQQMQGFFSGQGLAQGKDAHARDFMSAMDPLGFYASMPGIGYTREKQEQFAHLYQQWNEYERKSREYNASLSKVGLEAVRKFQEYIANPPEGQEPLKSLKDIYAKWIDICEGIYAKYAMSDEYVTLYGEVVNALMAFKKKQNEALDSMVEQFNLPTRAEIDSLHKQVHQLKRDLAELKKPKTVKTAPQKTAKKGKKS